MSNNVNRVWFSKKIGDETLFIGGETASDFEADFRTLLGEQTFVDVVGKFAASLITTPGGADPVLDRAVQTVVNSGLVGQQYAQQAPLPPAQQWNQAPPAPVQAGPSCAHGPRTYKEGVSKQGKPYKAWFCSSQDRNNQCPAEWAK